ncbi:protein of unknown function [Parapedobacter composti]|uniref:DUF4302 domain-containing protein n=1 Tax=Parapedobacter composti TaxID=623281 RepID=A0A1I1LCN8_9SPHI|nr:DUF4302 domain-containing protein [Parapedobacter composti]SFC68778.1 protein of unknown function [Parapedobacter composti]
MNRYLTFVLLLATFVCCKKENNDNYEVEKVHADPEALMAEFTEALYAGSLGWQATLIPKSGKIYTLFFKMDKAGNVWTLLDLDVNTARQPKRGTYRLDASANHASISFSAGTYLDDVTHKEGFRTVGADTSYAFKYANGDTLVLRGNRNGDELRMVHITAQEELNFEYGILGNSYIYMYNFFVQKPFFSFSIPGHGPVQVALNPGARGITMFFGENNRGKVVSSDYAYGVNRIVLKTPIRIGSHLISELTVDTEMQTFYIASNGDRLDLEGANMPVVPLHLLLGTGYPPYVSLPSPYFIEELPGWSEPFHQRYYEATENMLFSPYGLQLGVFAFHIDGERDRMNLEVFFGNQGGTYKAVYPYSYDKTSDGVYSFNALPFERGNVLHENAEFIKQYMAPLLDLINTDSFTMQLYDYGGDDFLAQMTSVERPEIYFTGYMFGYQLN